MARGARVTFTLYGPTSTQWLNVERSIRLANDVGGWEFRVSGTVQPFEDLAAYENSRAAERFTVDMLESYGRALGIALFDEAFYGGPGVLVDATSWLDPLVRLIRAGPRERSLAEARTWLGIE